MNEQQLLCFLTVSRTLNFTGAARELFCTQPALSYQIRCLEKELGTELFKRTTTSVELTEAGRALLPHMQQTYRALLQAYSAVKPFARRREIVLRLPESLLRRDPIYPLLMQSLHAALPDHEISVCTDRVSGSLHRMLAAEADAAVYMPFAPLPPEAECLHLMRAECYIVVSPSHPLADRHSLTLSDLNGHQVYYESIYDDYVRFLEDRFNDGAVAAPVYWKQTASYETLYSALLDGRCALLSPMKYDTYPESWYIPLQMHAPLPDVCLLTLRDDRRVFLPVLREIFVRTYRELYPDMAVY